MARHRMHLPQLPEGPFLTDGGLETFLIFHDGFDLPHFAAFVLLRDETGTEALRSYFQRYVGLARKYGTGLVLESPTWRAGPDWAARLGCPQDELEALNRAAIQLLGGIREASGSDAPPMVISGCVGPRGDGYSPEQHMSAAEAEDYHEVQIRTFPGTEADLVSAITMTHSEEAVGITRAASAAGMPAVVSFTVETDGRLPSGQPLEEAIRAVDEATGAAPAHYMINCAHPDHFRSVLENGGHRLRRIRGLRANASRKSHAELDEATELDAGDPVELGEQYRALRDLLPELNVLGGCCGTDHRHVDAIGRACLGDPPPRAT